MASDRARWFMSEVRTGFFPVVRGGDVTVRQAGVSVAAAARDMRLTQSGGGLIGAGNNLEITQGGGMIVGAGNKVAISQGGGSVVAARTVNVEHSYVGIAIGGEVNLGGDSRVVLGSAESLVVGALAGVIVALVGVFLRRR